MRIRAVTLIAACALPVGCSSSSEEVTTKAAQSPIIAAQASGQESAEQHRRVSINTASAAQNQDVKLCCDGNTQTSDPDLTAASFESFIESIAIADRKPLDIFDTTYIDQAGSKGRLSEFLGRPLAITFFYTRCDNRLKCSTAVSSFAKIQRLLKHAGLEKRVSLLMASYEPHHDSPARSRSYGESRGVSFDDFTKIVLFHPDGLKALIETLRVPVNYNESWVNLHGIVLYLVDDQGRLARKYHTLRWDPSQVVHDLNALVLEVAP